MKEANGSRLPGDGCDRDWIWDRAVETEGRDAAFERAAAVWERQQQHLIEHSEFYRPRLREVGGHVALADLHRLPFTSKPELRAALDARPPFGANLSVPTERVKRVYQTSGTTGSPSLIALTESDAEAWTAIGARTYYATGVHHHSTVLSTFGAGPFVAGHTHYILNRVGAGTVPVGPGDTERVVFALRAGIADTLLATPSFAQYLANLLSRTGLEPGSLALRHVVTGGEPGGGIPSVRDHIEASLGVVLNEVMGIGDIAPSLFGECPAKGGMHFSGAGYVWPELVDPDSRDPIAIEAGAVGELVYTHLAREAMPMVRFLSGDLVRIEGTECVCGRTSFRMRCIGRRDDMFIVRGVNVYPSAVVELVSGFRPRVTGRARVIRVGDGVAVEPPVPVQVEIPSGDIPDPGLAAGIEAAVRARLTFRCSVELLSEADFGDAGYKTRLTVRRA